MAVIDVLAQAVPLETVQDALGDVPVAQDALDDVLGALSDIGVDWGQVVTAVAVAGVAAIAVPVVAAILQAREIRAEFDEASAKRLARHAANLATGQITKQAFDAFLFNEKRLWLQMNRDRADIEFRLRMKRLADALIDALGMLL